ncbi:MAG: alpha/beta hydrolase [Clostridiaceae bacterium]|nr:alpha/beta hydrolase [Clostridiaceae bacterium]
MRLLMLYGVNCTTKVWDDLKPYLSKYETVYAEYPHEVTKCADNVEALTKWVYENYGNQAFDVIIGHSLGGIIALQLSAEYGMPFSRIIYLDTNLKPANEFYRNLMTPQNMKRFGDIILPMFKEESQFYSQKFFDCIKDSFDYTPYLMRLDQKVYGIYGDRNRSDYKARIDELNLPDEVLEKLDLRFVSNACHMIMMENPAELFETLEEIIDS